MTLAAPADRAYDLLGRIDTGALYPPFLERLNTLLNNCRARGQDYVATSGLRTYDQQDALYAKGRTAPGKIVTHAMGGFSKHNFACATDFQPHVPSFPDHGGLYTGALAVVPEKWEGKRVDSDPYYAILGEEAHRLGLEWGGAWGPDAPHDTPHVQLPLAARGITMDRLRTWYLEGGLPGVFRHLDDEGPW